MDRLYGIVYCVTGMVWHNCPTRYLYAFRFILPLEAQHYVPASCFSILVSYDRAQLSKVINNQWQFEVHLLNLSNIVVESPTDGHYFPDSKVHRANIGPTWVLSAPDRPHVGPMNLALRVAPLQCSWIVPIHSFLHLHLLNKTSHHVKGSCNVSKYCISINTVL